MLILKSITLSDHRQKNGITHLYTGTLDGCLREHGHEHWRPVSRRRWKQPAELIERATAATAALFEQKPGLLLIKDIPDDLPALTALTADRDRIIQVLINLISNAVKFTKVGQITVGVGYGVIQGDGHSVIKSLTHSVIGLQQRPSKGNKTGPSVSQSPSQMSST